MRIAPPAVNHRSVAASAVGNVVQRHCVAARYKDVYQLLDTSAVRVVRGAADAYRRCAAMIRSVSM